MPYDPTRGAPEAKSLRREFANNGPKESVTHRIAGASRRARCWRPRIPRCTRDGLRCQAFQAYRGFRVYPASLAIRAFHPVNLAR